MIRVQPWTRAAIAASLISVAGLTARASAQQGGDRTPRGDSLRQAQRLDVDGKHAEARAIFQKLIDNAADPAAKAAAQRTIWRRSTRRRRRSCVRLHGKSSAQDDGELRSCHVVH